MLGRGRLNTVDMNVVGVRVMRGRGGVWNTKVRVMLGRGWDYVVSVLLMLGRGGWNTVDILECS